MAEAMANWSPYNYVLGDPISLTDPTGMYPELNRDDYEVWGAQLTSCSGCGLTDERGPNDVIIRFDRENRSLQITDLDHYQEGLPTVFVSAPNYVQGGLRDKNGDLTANQVLVINNVFTGGESTNGNVSRDTDRPQNSIPEGTYDIVDNNADTRHVGWYRLDAQDWFRFDDKHSPTGRDGFRLHKGLESWGCVTCDTSLGDRSEEWNVLQTVLKNTSTKTVNDRRGLQFLNAKSELTVYGTLEVTGKDKIQIKN
jgi:hypothetical protein